MTPVDASVVAKVRPVLEGVRVLTRESGIKLILATEDLLYQAFKQCGESDAVDQKVYLDSLCALDVLADEEGCPHLQDPQRAEAAYQACYQASCESFWEVGVDRLRTFKEKVRRVEEPGAGPSSEG